MARCWCYLVWVMALVPGAALFGAVGLKPDLGASDYGHTPGRPRQILPSCPKSLFLFKELFLVAFFLTIGQQGIPSMEEISTALTLLMLLPLKLVLFLGLLLFFRFRLRTAFMSSLTLGNFSEFGLIVMTAAIATGTLDASWLRVMALMVAFSFLIAAPLDRMAQGLYHWLQPKLQHRQRHPPPS